MVTVNRWGLAGEWEGIEWVGWKSDGLEANIRTFPPSPPTHDIAVRFAWLLSPDWVGETIYGS